MQDYRFLCVAVTFYATLVNMQTTFCPVYMNSWASWAKSEAYQYTWGRYNAITRVH